MEPSGGNAWVAGHHVVRDAERIKENIGYMSQRFGLYADLTVMENLNFYADIYSEPRRGRGEKIDRLLSFSNLTPFKRRLAGNLSGGMKQKLGLACALIHTPKVLFLDEPTNGVDPVSRRDFWRILHQLHSEKGDDFRLDGLPRRGRPLRPRRPDPSRAAAGVRHAAEVKKLMRGTILEIRMDDPRPAVPVLRQRLTGVTVGLFGDRLHVVSLEPGADRRRGTSRAGRRRPERSRRPHHRAVAGRRVHFGVGERRRTMHARADKCKGRMQDEEAK